MKTRNSMILCGVFIVSAFITVVLANKYQDDILYWLCVGLIILAFMSGLSCLPNLRKLPDIREQKKGVK